MKYLLITVLTLFSIQGFGQTIIDTSILTIIDPHVSSGGIYDIRSNEWITVVDTIHYDHVTHAVEFEDTGIKVVVYETDKTVIREYERREHAIWTDRNKKYYDFEGNELIILSAWKDK